MIAQNNRKHECVACCSRRHLQEWKRIVIARYLNVVYSARKSILRERKKLVELKRETRFNETSSQDHHHKRRRWLTGIECLWLPDSSTTAERISERCDFVRSSFDVFLSPYHSPSLVDLASGFYKYLRPLTTTKNNTIEYTTEINNIPSQVRLLGSGWNIDFDSLLPTLIDLIRRSQSPLCCLLAFNSSLYARSAKRLSCT